MTHPDIARWRLRSQRIDGNRFRRPNEVVRWLGAVQAQDYAGATWAIGVRLQDGRAVDVESAFADGALLRTHMLRPTWHFVTPGDIRWMLALTGPRVHALNAHMYRKLELDAELFGRACDAVARALAGGNQLTRGELQEALKRSGIDAAGQRLAYIMMYAELERLICSGARRGRQFTYALMDERVPPSDELGREEALSRLALRYFVSRGPATVRDFAGWSGLTLADARAGHGCARDRLRRMDGGDQTYWSAEDGPDEAPESASDAHLLSIYDEYVSGYKDRSAMIDPECAEVLRVRARGNAPAYIIVLDGRIVGSSRRNVRRDAIEIETSVFRRLSTGECRAVAAAVQRYGAFFEVPVTFI